MPRVANICCRALAATLLLGSPLLAHAEDWPNWRGPQHDGISRETGWSSDWGEHGPKKLWTANVGTGFSSISIAAGRGFTAGHRDDHDTVFCFDAETGVMQWNYEYPAPLVDNLHEGGPAATPTIDGDLVYSVSKDGQLHCFEIATGKVVWRVNIGDIADVPMPQWGFSCSPLLVDEMLIVEAGSTLALDKTTGRLIWKSERYEPGYGSPAPCIFDGIQHVAVLNNDELILVRCKDGRVVASHPWKTDYDTSSTTPIVVGDDVFISTGYKRGCSLLHKNGGRLETVYENRNMSNHMATCVLRDGHLYGIDGNSHNARICKLVCLDFATGAVKWSERGFGCGSVLMADGKLIVLSDDGHLVIAATNTERYEEIARSQVIDGRCWTVPTLANGRIYCRNAVGDVVCLDVRAAATP